MDQLPEDNRERLEQSTASTSGAASPAATSSSKEESGQKPAEPSSSSSAVPTVPTPAATGTASSATDSALTTVKGKEGLDDDLDLLAPILGALGDDEGTLESASTATDKNTSLSTGRKKADVIDLLQSSKGRRRRSALDEPEAPHRPKSAYTLFTETLIKDGYLGTAKMVSAKWRALSNEDHYKFDELALADKARYQEDIKKYFGNKGQDLMSVLMQCSTDTGPSKRQREESDHPVAPQKRAARSADEDALADLFDMGDDDNDSSRGASQPAEVQAPQLRLDASGKIIVDAASLQASTSNALRGVSTISSSAMPFEQAYKRTKRMKWTEEEDARFWKAVSAYGSDFLLIQTLFRDKTSHQIKMKYKSEEKRNRAKMDDHLYGSSRSTFTRDLFESQFGKIDSAKHFVPPADDGNDETLAVEDKATPAKKESLPQTVAPQSVAPAAEVEEAEKNAQFDALLDLFD